VSPISQGSPISFSGYSPSPYTALNLISNERNLISLEKLEEQVKQKIHSRKFREYCNQIINRDIDAICMSLLQEIVRFQDRLYHKNPMKAKMKRRYVMGIREVTKHLKLNKLKCIILAPNCEKIQSKGGLDDAINFIIQTSMEQNVPFVFALGRKGLGKAVNKLVPISVVGIFDYSGAEEYFKRLVELANNAKLAYQDIVEEYEKEECENLILMQSNVINNQATADSTKDIIKATNGLLFNPPTATNLATTMPKIPSHMAHSRTPSTGSNISIEPFFMNYHTHSRSASGNFNYGHTTTIAPGHSRSASSGGGGTLNLDLSLNKNWATHSRTPSNCSNISFISRLSEPISEVGTLYLAGSNSSINYLNTNSTLAAVQFYNEQVRQEMSGAGGGADSLSNSQKSHLSDSTASTTHHVSEDNNIVENKDNISASLANLHLGSINENDAGNEADNECENNNLVETKNKRYLKKQSSSTDTTEATEEDIQKAISI
jgi:ribosomal protein L7Ae-like RNA K-turn-binding protein